MSLPAPHEVVERALAAADGPCVVLVDESHQAEVRFANNTATTNGRRRDRRVAVIRFCDVEGGIAAGVASRSGDVDVAAMLEAAAADARSSPASPDAAPLVDRPPDDGFDTPPAEGDLGAFGPIVDALAPAFDSAANADRVLAGFVEQQVDTVYLGSSTGLRRRHSQPTTAVQMVARSRDGSRSAWVADASADLASVDIAAMDAHLAARLEWASRSVALPEGRYEVVLPPSAVADLMIDLVNYAGGQDAEDGSSAFSAPGGGTRVGEQLCDLPFALYGDPAEPGLECAPFLAVGASSSESSVYDNGIDVGRTPWIEHGRLSNLRYHRAGAARSATNFAPPVDNLVLDLPDATGTTEELVARTERGLLLTCLWYIREVDPASLLLTGLTRDGVYLVERGEVVGAVNNFRFNESPIDVLARTSEAGTSVRSLGREFGEWVNRSRTPPLRVIGFNMSSTSAAS
ncbi:MAG: metallopeptidase TldD-related protein [Acidimicrobiales bacterium]